MATVHFQRVVKISSEIHEAPAAGKIFFHILLDTKTTNGDVQFEEVIILWEGDKQALFDQLGIKPKDRNDG